MVRGAKWIDRQCEKIILGTVRQMTVGKDQRQTQGVVCRRIFEWKNETPPRLCAGLIAVQKELLIDHLQKENSNEDHRDKNANSNDHHHVRTETSSEDHRVRKPEDLETSEVQETLVVPETHQETTSNAVHREQETTFNAVHAHDRTTDRFEDRRGTLVALEILMVHHDAKLRHEAMITFVDRQEAVTPVRSVDHREAGIVEGLLGGLLENRQRIKVPEGAGSQDRGEVARGLRQRQDQHPKGSHSNHLSRRTRTK